MDERNIHRLPVSQKYPGTHAKKLKSRGPHVRLLFHVVVLAVFVAAAHVALVSLGAPASSGTGPLSPHDSHHERNAFFVTGAATSALTAGVSLQTPFDTIPNFARTPTIWSIGPGSWSAPGTWNLNRVPNSSDVVLIGIGTSVVIDDTAAVAKMIGVDANGTLRFSPAVSTRLTAETILVYEDGTLEVGTTANPIPAGITAEIVIADQPFDFVLDPRQYGHGIIALGNVRMHGAALDPTFVRLASEPRIGNQTLVVSQPVTGWRIGDRISLPSTDPFQAANACCYGGDPASEEFTITSLSGTVVGLSNPIAKDNHKAARDSDGTVRFLPHVLNLERNVIIRSENPSGVRGHTLFTMRSGVDIRFVAFENLGRTLDSPLDSTTLNADGTVSHIGTNQIGRYVFHAHHLYGPVNPTNTGYQFQFIGNALDGGTKWGVTIHDSHYGLIKDTVVHNALHGAFVTEDGNEAYNTFEHNMASHVVRGDGFYLLGIYNYFRNNVAANAYKEDIASDGGYSFGMYGLRFLKTNQIFPLVRGADTSYSNLQTENRTVTSTTFLAFDDNEGYGGLGGVWVDHRPGGKGTGGHQVKNFKGWSFVDSPVIDYNSDGVTVDGLIARRCDNGVNFQSSSGERVVVNSDIQTCAIGIYLPAFEADGFVEIRNSYLRNAINTQIHFLISINDPAPKHYKKVAIRNVSFDAPPGMPLKNFDMVFHPFGINSTAIAIPHVVEVYDYNKTPGANYRVFFRDQAPDVIIPSTAQLGPNFPKGCPVAGLTNQQCWETYGIATGAEVAYCNTAPAEVINGFFCPITAQSPKSFFSQIDFGAVQGANGWNYRASNGAVLPFDPLFGRWIYLPDDPVLWMMRYISEPGSSFDAVRRWTSPGTGTVRFGGRLFMQDSAGDGVAFMVKKGSSVLLQRNIAGGDMNGVFVSGAAVVAAGDVLDFILNKNGTTASDNTFSTYTVVFTPSSSILRTIRVDLEGVVSNKTRTGTLQFLTPGTLTPLAEINVTTDMAGEYTFPVPGGLPSTVTLRVSLRGYLTKLSPNADLAAPALTVVTLPTLSAGDFNGDSSVNSLDWSIMNRNWFGSHEFADINRDGVVNSLDFSFLSKNWLLRGE